MKKIQRRKPGEGRYRIECQPDAGFPFFYIITPEGRYLRSPGGTVQGYASADRAFEIIVKHRAQVREWERANAEKAQAVRR